MLITVPKFKTQEEKFDWLAENVDDHIDAKKSTFKKADAVGFSVETYSPELRFKWDSDKQETVVHNDGTMIKRKVVINTTKILDSHEDVHIDGLWNKSLKENKRIKFLQEHVNKFDHIIADKKDLKASLKMFSWKELGYDAEGETQALLFNANIKEARNPFMFKQYAEDNVDNHSVGMNYVKIYFAMNSDKENHAAYKDAWDKYRPMIVNGADADKKGYFYAVTEAKVREGSAVVDGSNFVTPTLPTKEEPTPGPSNKVSKEMREWLGLSEPS